ncbi:MAG: hypothetical protein ABI868_20705 [Acidobacteriota bacterium]
MTQRLHGAAVAACALLGAWVAGAPSAHAQSMTVSGLATRIQSTTDTRWLESIANSTVGVAPSIIDLEQLQQALRLDLTKAARTLAYARLGELGTAESLAAIGRIEVGATQIIPTTPTVPARIWPAVAWHTGDLVVDPLAQTTVPDGTTYVMVSANLLGAFDFFLLSRRATDPPGWSRPRLVERSRPEGVRGGRLTAGAGETLTFGFTFAGAPGARALQLSLLDLNQDSDGDGWTDREEGRLETDPHDPDSDGDGMFDGADVCPLYAAPPQEAGDEEAVILQKAVFAAFGLTGSRQLLYVTPESRRIHLFGYGGPVLFGHPMPRDGSAGGPYVSWRIAERHAAAARVELSDRRSAASGGGQDVQLRKIGGTWVVVSRRTTWVS